MNKNIEIADAIATWHRKNRIEYPFRQNRDFYRTWVSEIILQQTRMEYGEAKIKQFLDKIPTLQALADAGESKVLEAFQGLGYYNRARNLHKGARAIVYTLKRIPENYEELVKVPSIGDYTAAMIASIVFKKPVAAIDTNIQRALSRLFAISDPPSTSSFKQKSTAVLDQWIRHYPQNPGWFNEAMIEFGQKVCSKKPLCPTCPVKSFCKAHREGKVELYPPQRPVKQKIDVDWTFYIIRDKKLIFLETNSDPCFLKEPKVFPSTALFQQTKKVHSSSNIAESIYRMAPETQTGPKHSITHHKIQTSYSIIDYTELPKKLKTDGSLQPYPLNEIDQIFHSNGYRKIWKTVFKELL